MRKPLLSTAHAIGGTTAFVTILGFLASTVAAELFGDTVAVAEVKAGIVFGLYFLVPALALTGVTGFALAGRNPKGMALVKLRRMKIVGPNGVLVLIPAALYLNGKAVAGEFDLAFLAVQAVELIAGSINLALIGLNIRDGLRMTRRLDWAKSPTSPGV